MRQTLFSLAPTFLCIFSCLSTTTALAQQRDLTWRVNPTVTLAQITPDDTLGTQVNSQGNVDEITGGQTRGDNLFHSFQDFSVENGSEAFFNNADNISSIFSRVTGVNISTIDGLIRANGSANLFLINPNGIIFGEGASLDIGGSFLGSTASSILFDDGEFSATEDLDSPPLLTINAPIGLGLPDNPAEIVNRSTVQDSEANIVGLEVRTGNNLSLVGGDIKFEGGQATASGGNVELGGLSKAGTIAISEDGSLTFPEDVAKADLTLNDNAAVDVRSLGAGNITVNSRNFSLTENSQLEAGILAESTSTNAQAGDIKINLTENLNLDNSRINNTVASEGIGNSGNINIATGLIQVINGGQINGSTSGKGNAGSVSITATDDITIDGENENSDSGVISFVNPGAEGNAGNITIFTGGSLTLTNGGRVDTSTSNQGNGGNINITATGDITIDGADLDQFGSGVISFVNPGAEGNAGNITIFTGGNLTLTNPGRVSASNNSSNRGNGGYINITATGDITIDGKKNKNFEGNVASQINPETKGNAGDIFISTGGNLTLIDRGRVDTGNNSQGDAGDIFISTGGNLTLIDEGRVDTGNNGQGDSGDIFISTGGNLTSTQGGQLNTSVNNGPGNGGNINITSMGNIVFAGDDVNGDGSGAISLVGTGVKGDAGNITISTGGKLTLTDGGRVDASTNEGEGNAGSIDINAIGDITFEGEDSRDFGSGATSQVNPGVEQGNSGGITISTQGNLTLKDGGRVDTSTNALGDAGSIDINAIGDITFEGKTSQGQGSGATSQVNPQGIGNAGGVTISTQGNLTLKDGGRVDVSINALGDRENVATTNNNQATTFDNANINLQVAKDTILNNSLISARASGNANGGNLIINSRFIIAEPNSNSDIIASAQQGNGGNIDIDANSLFGIEERPLDDSTNDINASSEFGFSGTVELNLQNADPSRDSLNLPGEPIQAEVTQTCQINNSSSDRSEFVVTRRGGLPPEPEDNFRLRAIAIPENFPQSESLQQQGKALPSIVEATRWVRNAEGKILLLASPINPSSLNYHSNSADCNS